MYRKSILTTFNALGLYFDAATSSSPEGWISSAVISVVRCSSDLIGSGCSTGNEGMPLVVVAEAEGGTEKDVEEYRLTIPVDELQY